jgi:hypothetical protein
MHLIVFSATAHWLQKETILSAKCLQNFLLHMHARTQADVSYET